jgi:hypothetical protein
MLLKEASPFEAFKQGALMLLDHLAKDSAQPQRNDDWFRRLQSSHASVGSGFGTGGAVNCAPHVINLHVCPFSFNTNAKTNLCSDVTPSYNEMTAFIDNPT